MSDSITIKEYKQLLEVVEEQSKEITKLKLELCRLEEELQMHRERKDTERKLEKEILQKKFNNFYSD